MLFDDVVSPSEKEFLMPVGRLPRLWRSYISVTIFENRKLT